MERVAMTHRDDKRVALSRGSPMKTRKCAGATALLILLGYLASCTSAHGGVGTSDAASPSGAETPDAVQILDAAQTPDPEHATTDAGAALPKLFKGYELYVWDEASQLRFMLITGTNRLKTLEELGVESAAIDTGDWIQVSGRGLPALRGVLVRLPDGTQLHIHDFAQLPALSAESRARVEALLDELAL